MTSIILRNLHSRSLQQPTSTFSSLIVPCQYQYRLLFSNPNSATLRYSSSSSSSTTTRTASSSKKPIEFPHTTKSSKSIARVNGPLSTLPPELSVPDRTPSQSTPGYLFSIGKAYLTFYKTGAKAIYANYKDCKPIQARINADYKGSLAKAASAKAIDRQQFLLLTRSWFDVKRVPIFGLVFAICGEFTPLVVIALTSVVPYVCRIPKQINGDRKKLEKRRMTSFRNLTMSPPNDATTKKEDGKPAVKVVHTLKRMQLIHISWSLGLSSSAWDWLGGQLPGLPTSILRRKVQRWTEYLEIDDTLIAREGGVKEMSSEEVLRAAVDRGIDVTNKKVEDVRGDLRSWSDARKKGRSIERLLLTRPSVWSS